MVHFSFFCLFFVVLWKCSVGPPIAGVRGLSQ